MGLVEATFAGLALLAIMVSLAAVLASVALGALRTSVGEPEQASGRVAPLRAVTWRVVDHMGNLSLTNGRDYIALQGELVTVRGSMRPTVIDHTAGRKPFTTRNNEPTRIEWGSTCHQKTETRLKPYTSPSARYASQKRPLPSQATE